MTNSIAGTALPAASTQQVNADLQQTTTALKEEKGIQNQQSEQAVPPSQSTAETKPEGSLGHNVDTQA